MADVYASTSALTAIVFPAGTSAPDSAADRLAASVILGTHAVDVVLGNPVPLVSLLPPYTTTAVPCDPSWQAAALAAAVFYYKLPEAPFGVIGGWDYAVRLRDTVPPHVRSMLLGQAPGDWLVA